MIVNGAYRGLRAIMDRLNERSFSVTVRIDQVEREREREREVYVSTKILTLLLHFLRVQPEAVLLTKCHMEMFANLHSLVNQ